MYAFGMVIHEVVTGARPFGPYAVHEFLRLSTRGIRLNRPEDPVAVGFGQGTWEFAKRCLDENPERRPMAGEASEHFEHVAKTSKAVDPGPVVPDDAAAGEIPTRLDDSSGYFCECRGYHVGSPL